jgi:hypothetical protein
MPIRDSAKIVLPKCPPRDTMSDQSSKRIGSPMKIVIILSLLLLTSAAFGELTKEDIRAIIKEEITASEKRMKEYIDLKIETLDQKVNVLDESLNIRIDTTNTRIDVLDESLNVRIDYVAEDFDPFWITIIVLVVSTLLLPIVIALVYGKLM